jgi:hypothetical protein
VTLADGNQVDVQLNDKFQVVGSKNDGPAANDTAGTRDGDGNCRYELWAQASRSLTAVVHSCSSRSGS